MNLANLPRYATACLRALFTAGPRSYLKLLSRSPYTVKDLPDYGVSILVDVRDPAISKPILVLGEYEPGFTQVLLALARRSSTFLDVGANIGFFSLLAASVMKSGRIWSIEPDPENVRILRANIALNTLQDQVEVSHAAASDQDGEVYFSTLGYAANIGARFTAKDPDALLARTLPGSAAPTKVRALKVDTLLRDQKLDLAKIDVEGHEPSVLAGMQHILAVDRPVILSEFAPGTIQHINRSSPSDYLDGIASHQYTFAVVEDDGEVRETVGSAQAVLARSEQAGRHHIDLMLIPKEKANKTLEDIAASRAESSA